MNKNTTDQIVVTTTKWIGIILFFVIVLWAGNYFVQMNRYEQTNDAQVEAYLSPINAKVGGYISKVYFHDNQEVQKGDTLVLIDPDESGLKKETAQAELMSSRARLIILSANEETQIKTIEVTKARIAGFTAKLEQQQREFERYKNLLADESTTQQKFENVRTSMLINKSDYKETLASLEVAEAKLNEIKAQRASIEAEIKIKESLLKRQDLDLKYTVIRAPFNGQIGKKTIQEGQLIQPSQTLAFLINKSEDKWIVANFKETQIKTFFIGQKAMVEIDAFSGEKFSGTIESLAPTTGSRYSLLPPDNATGNFVKVIQRIPVRIKLTDSKEKLSKLSAGMNANVDVLKN